ncbi:MAG: ABC transporter permease subunit [Cytophagales bacterium]|nr:ABC transporter permease subunit [Cytophagales bacterium]
MLHLLKVDLMKMTSYRTFWVICGLYFLTLGFTTASGMEILKWLANKSLEFGASININRIPLYHFPDIWQNLIWISGLFKIILAVMVVISITNEYQYRTLRQNIIDGLSRWEFLQSKILTNVLLSLVSVGMILLITLLTGFIYTPKIDWAFFLRGTEFFLVYFIEVFSFLSFALMLGFLIQRSGLTIVVLMLAHMIEAIIKVNIFRASVNDQIGWLKPLFPLESITNLVPMPFARYAFQEIQDYVAITAVVVAIGWAILFNYFAYLKLTKSDI